MQIPFPNPPITEALFDIRVQLPSETSLTTLLTLQDRIKTEFPNKKDRHLYEAKFQFNPGTTPEIVQSPDVVDGYLFISLDGKKIVQARLDGFTFNKLKPYSNWEEFSKEALSLFQHYIDIAKPTYITRLALRYINRIEIPLPLADFKEYILTVPEIAPNIPNSLAGFFTRLIVPNPELEATAIITETLDDKVVTPNTVPFIFDIDVVKNVKLQPDIKQIIPLMNQLRDFKNQIFLNSITAKGKELFK